MIKYRNYRYGKMITENDNTNGKANPLIMIKSVKQIPISFFYVKISSLQPTEYLCRTSYSQDIHTYQYYFITQ